MKMNKNMDKLKEMLNQSRLQIINNKMEKTTNKMMKNREIKSNSHHLVNKISKNNSNKNHIPIDLIIYCLRVKILVEEKVSSKDQVTIDNNRVKSKYRTHSKKMLM